jgi:hypothetical protein
LQKLKNRKAKADQRRGVRTQDIKVRSMLMRVRNQAKCVGTSALTSNLLVSLVFSPGIELTPIFFRTWRPLREPSLRIFSPAKTLSSQRPR